MLKTIGSPDATGELHTFVGSFPCNQIVSNCRVLARGARFAVPYGGIAIPLAAVAALPWIRLARSLRTLLIAITLIGLILGTIIATTR